MVSLDNIAKQISGQKYPPVHLWHPDFCGDIDIRIASDGAWFYMGSPIERAPLVKLFSSVLRFDDDGEYYLVTPVEKLKIKVDVAPLIVVEMFKDGKDEAKNITFRTLTDDLVPLDFDHPLIVTEHEKTKEPCPKVKVRGNLSALINRSVFYELVDKGTIDPNGDQNIIGIWSSNIFFPLGKIEG
jgi:uncharacterized protein